jgi:hypothetical protein
MSDSEVCAEGVQHEYVEALPAGDLLRDSKQFRIRVADTEGRLGAADFLVDQMYGWRGYDTDAARASGEGITLVASVGDVMFGTITINLDSPAGLPADDVYGDRLRLLRNSGARLWEATKFAVKQDVRSKQVLATLFHLSYIYTHRILGLTDVVLEVNPRHVPFYRRILRADIFGEERICQRVNAPAVLLRIHLPTVEERMKEDVRGALRFDRSLFFSREDEDDITSVLRAL